ncbi:MAG TPA: hypothetical protein VL981_13310 [Candidatus Methylacidiphilales bacterium]|nr:hypothetical protein [Candidatus Methylacidiphilales bacterium]
MKRFRLLVLAVPLFLAACGLSDQQKADYQIVHSKGVNPAIYDKMVHGDSLSLYDIKALSRAHVSDAIILRYLRDQGTVYSLSSQDVIDLQKAGVSQSVIDYMLQTPRNYGPYPPPYYGYPYGYPGPYWGPYPYWGWAGGPYYHRHWH